ncbi:MAG: hypothetical protein AAFN77_06425 [Planctomycetota bacterium]
MNHPSQEDLLGYVLGALDAQEQRELQQQLDQLPDSEEQLLAIKASLSPLDLLDTPGHRPGLARRTCELVANYDAIEAAERLRFLDDCEAFANSPSRPSVGSIPSDSNSIADILVWADDADTAMTDERPIQAASTAAGSASSDQTSKLIPSDRRFSLNPTSWSMMDMWIGVACLAILAGILFPVVSWGRYQSRLMACQDNLRQVGNAFMLYSSNNDNQFVAIPADGNLSASGCYGPILKDAGLLNDDSLLACAGLGSSVAPVFIPTCQQVLAAATRTEINHYHQTMGGHYGYSMGHCEDSQYVAPRNGGQTFVVLLADRPSTEQPGRTSLNHRGVGQNCLFADGRVGFVKGHAYGNDALFENDYGVVAPGSSEFDNVIAPSHLSPTLGIQMNTAPNE